MGLPSKKRPKSEKRNRRAANRLKKINYSSCRRCGKPVRGHRFCQFCGTYKDKEVIRQKDTSKKTVKK